MLINGVLNVAIGLALTFGTVSLVTSAITEAIAQLLALRSKTLLAGVKQLLNDPNATGLALAIYQHAAVNPLGSGKVPTANWQTTGGSYQAVRALLGSMPSYIPSRGFASALIDAIQNRQQPGGFQAGLANAIADIADPQLKALISGFYARAGQKEDELHARLAGWFDAAMDRLSGDYKRWSQRIGLIVAGVLVVVLNIDALDIARHIYADPGLLQHFNGQMDNDPAVALNAWAKTFPFTGWQGHAFGNAVLLAVPGWVFTTVATLFGAPFWFDTLQRFVQIRGTGPEPEKAAS